MAETGDLGDLLRKREEIDGELSRFKKPLAVIFADIKGSTDYFDRWGDLEGKLMVQRCEDIMLPVFEGEGARYKRLGDGVMAYFEDTEVAVRAAMTIQRKIHGFNRGKDERLQIHVRIGINAGLAFLEDDDISGDVVNVASRVESIAPVDGICISRKVYEQIRHADEIICRSMGERELKGKAEPIQVYQVKWAEEELTVGTLRGNGLQQAAMSPAEKGTVFHLEVFCEGDKVRVKSHEGMQGEERTLRFYEDANLSLRKVEGYAARIKALLDKANQRGKVGGEILASLKQTGQLLFEELLPPRTRQRLGSTGVKSLVLNLDESLVHIPWELIYDGREFLCQRFSMGRVVSTKQEFRAGHREIGLPLRMLLLADPQGNLPSSYDEGITVRDMLDHSGDLINVSLKTSDISTDYVRSKIRFFDIVHYAGHTDYVAGDPAASGFLLSDGKLGARDIRNMVGRMPFPSLMVSNACRSGETVEWRSGAGYEKVFGMASAFLLSGVRHYVGTFWDVQDEPGRTFSVDLYGALLRGESIGEAVRRARQGLIERYGEDTILWASYLLYGDPTFRYVGEGQPGEAATVPGKTGSPDRETPAGTLRAARKDDAVVFPRDKKGPNVAVLGVLGLLALVAVIFLVQKRTVEPPASPASQTPRAPSVLPERSAEETRLKAERIDALVEELARKYREGEPSPPETRDPWTSAPVTIVFLGIATDGISEIEKDFILAGVVEDIQGNGRLRVVERELLDKLLSELRLSASDLSDSRTALKLGRLLSARLIATGGIVREGNTWLVNLRIIETETSSIKSAIAVTEETSDRSRIVAALSGRITGKIREWFPLQGKVHSVDGEGVTIDIGSNVGLSAQTTLTVLSEAMEPIGELRTTTVTADRARAMVISEGMKIGAGMLVRAKAH